MSSSLGVIPRNELKIWEIFRDVGPEGEEILKTAKLARVADTKEAFVVTTADETYSFLQTRFAHGSKCKIAKIPELCGVRVKEFAIRMVELAITEDGSLYSWIINDPDVFEFKPSSTDFALLGRLEGDKGGKSNLGVVVTPHRVLGSLSGKNVSQVTLSYKRVLALTVGGEVHQWGEAVSSWEPMLIPKQHFQYQNVTSIACCNTISVALTSNGELFQWALDNKVPQKVVVDNNTAPFKKITAGSNFILGLTVNGALYSGRLKISVPVWTALFGGQEFQDIATSGDDSLAIFELKNNTRFAFAHTEENSYPPLTSFSQRPVSIEEFFAENTQATYRTICARSCLKPRTLSGDIATLWGSKENSDVTFSVEGKIISAHKFLLTSRSDYFAKMFSNEWNETKSASSFIEIKETKYEIFEALLFHIYHDEVSFSKDEYENIFGLMKLADAHCAVKIRQKCEKILMENITAENAVFLVRNAASANAPDLENTVIRFILDNGILDVNLSPQKLVELLGMETFLKISIASLRRM